jgi:hypothetical protein
VVLFGVDNVPFSGFHFYSGGVEAFLEAISSTVVLKKIGTKDSGRGRRDTTFNVLLNGASTDAAGGPAAPPQVPLPEPKEVPGFFATLSKFFASKEEKEVAHVGDRINDFMDKWQKNRLQRAFLGWRIFAYRRRKVKQKVRNIMKDDLVGGVAPTGVLTTDREGLTLERWAEGGGIADGEGRIIDPTAFYTALYNGSCDQSLRKIVWKTLLGQYQTHCSNADRVTRDAEVKLAFEARQKEMAPFIAALPERGRGDEGDLSFESQCTIIDLDVQRSEFLKDSTGAYNDKLNAVLRTWVYENSDSGYVCCLFSLFSVLRCFGLKFFISVVGAPGCKSSVVLLMHTYRLLLH